MAFWNRKKPEMRAKSEGTIEVDDALLRALLTGGTVTREMALQVPTVSGGIDLIGNIIASTPIKLYKEENGKALEVPDDNRLKLLNDETGDTLNANEFWKAMTRDYFLGKGGYAYIHRERGRVKSIHYVDEQHITIQKNTDPIFKDFDILVQGKAYRPFQFLKILRNTRDGAAGTPITQENDRLIEVAYESLMLERNLVKRGGNKKGFLKAGKKIDKESLDTLRTAFANLYSNTSDNMVVLNDGIDFKESSNTSTEMQLNESKLSNAEEFSKIFHISTDAMRGKATEADTASLARLAAIPLMETIQCELNRNFLLEKEKGVFYWAFDTKELLKGDLQSRFAAYKTALEANFMSIDEVRFLEDMPALGVNWLKLGLDSVLYDPDTKDIYTPNTNKQSIMGQQSLEAGPQEKHMPEQAATESVEPRANPHHDPKNGQFTSGSSSGFSGGLTSGGKRDSLQSSSKPEWSEKEAKEPFNYWELSADKTNFPARWKPTGFSHSNTLSEHFKGHGKSVGARDEADYQQKATDFLTSPRGKYGDAFVRKNGDVCRYDYDSGLYAVATKTGNIKTFWNLNKDRGNENAANYWEGDKKRNGK